jgi:transcriptional regulator with XRE-family HTH domain
MTGRTLRRLRKKHGLSVAKAADQVHVASRTWVRWEGSRTVPATAAHLFCLLLGVPFRQ